MSVAGTMNGFPTAMPLPRVGRCDWNGGFSSRAPPTVAQNNTWCRWYSAARFRASGPSTSIPQWFGRRYVSLETSGISAHRLRHSSITAIGASSSAEPRLVYSVACSVWMRQTAVIKKWLNCSHCSTTVLPPWTAFSTDWPPPRSTMTCSVAWCSSTGAWSSLWSSWNCRATS